MTLDGWHRLHDGHEGLYRDGVCVAAVRHEPGLDPPYATESWTSDGMCSLRNLATLEDARAHCERVANLPPQAKS